MKFLVTNGCGVILQTITVPNECKDPPKAARKIAKQKWAEYINELTLSMEIPWEKEGE